MKNRVEIVEKMQTELPRLEVCRKQLLLQKQQKSLYILIPGGILVVLLTAYLWQFMGWVALATLVMPLFFIVLILFEYLKLLTPRLQKQLQQVLGDKVLGHAYPDWTFQANDHLDLQTFEAMGVANGYKFREASNLVTGQFGDTAFAFCHLLVYGQEKDESDPFFNGLLLVFDFHKSFAGKTVVVRDSAQALLGTYLGKKVQEFGWKGLDLVYLEDPIFEQLFAVYGDDQIASRYILTPSMMENLITLRDKYGEQVAFSFIDGKVAVAIDHVYLYKTYIESPIHLQAAVDQFLRPIEMVQDVIQTLQLNTRIWTK